MGIAPGQACNPRENPYSWFIATFHRSLAVISTMYTLFAQLSRFVGVARGARALRAAQPVIAGENGVASQLMESAESRAGLNPRQARELRRAASAFLSVVR